MYKIHRRIDTLPVDCFMKIQESIESDEPDYRWLLVLPDYISLPESEIPDKKELETIYKELFYQFEADSLDLKFERLFTETLCFEFEQLAGIDDRRNKILFNEEELKKTGSKPDKKQSFQDLCTSIEMSLNIRVIPYATTVRQFYSYIKQLKNKK